MAAASSSSCERQPVQTAVDEDKVVYIQDGVFVHTAVSIATQSANIIPGRVTIIEKQNGSFVDWSPVVNEEEEFELESSDYSEWDLVTQSKEQGTCILLCIWIPF
ncbi:uncharacterized protein LOC110061755 [Orbicella faveolata]|uniref:uncharacterized protein LOC110061755 n=1 Tax=Orbicella faveolata TaxID=48498 RepID=UPI0009E30320|nr:uncharacterized protein LOC110061755 [Orbicella faveolata]